VPNVTRAAATAALLGILLPAFASAQPAADASKLFVRGYAGATFGSSDPDGDSEHAVTGGGGVGWNLSRHFAVIGDVGYIRTIASQQATDAVNTAAALITLVSGVDASVTLKAPTIYAMGGARYTLGGRRLMPFAEGQAGIARTTFDLSVSASDPVVVNDAKQIFKSVLGSDSANYPTVAAGGGVDIRLTHSIAAEASYRYMRLFGDAKSNIHMILGGVVVKF
jgi:opacity protein-like surface antigen